MSTNLSPVGGAAAQFFDSNGDPLSGGKIYTYQGGTTTPKATYTTVVGDVAHTNPIILDSAGRVPGGQIWVTTDGTYKFVLATSADVTIATYDNLAAFNTGGSYVTNATGNGVQTIFAVLFTPTAIFINGVYQNQSTYTVGTGTVTFSEAPPVTSTIEFMF